MALLEQAKPSLLVSWANTLYELTGADIMNVVQHCCLKSLQRGDKLIYQEDLLNAIKREFSKAGKVV